MRLFSIKYTLADGLRIDIEVNIETMRVLIETDGKLKALDKQDERHRDSRQPEECPGLWFDPPKSLEDQYIRKEQRLEVRDAFRCLSETQLRRVYAHFYQGLTFRQIAAMEGVSLASVRDSVHGAQKKLRKLLRPPTQNAF